MAPELEKYYNNYFSLFRNKGWKQLMEELNNTVAQTNDVQNTKDSDDLFIRKGQLAVMANILNLEATVRASHEQVVAEEQDVQSI
jgi:hypothetical protein